MNSVPDPNDSVHPRKIDLNKSAIEDAITVNVTVRGFSGCLNILNMELLLLMNLFFLHRKQYRVNLRTEDVIHSFWLPKLAGKMDLMPGQENFLWFVANEDEITS